MTYKDQRELENLPGEIEALERDIARIEGQLGNPAGLDGDGIARLGRLGLDLALAPGAQPFQRLRELGVSLERPR